MAEKYEGKKYNAYIHMQQHSLAMHFHSEFSKRYGLAICRARVCVRVRVTTTATSV